MKRVILESPYAGDIQAHLTYARRACADALHRGEAPFASHLLYTQEGILQDGIAAERQLGMEAGFEWGQVSDYTVVYTDYGISSGMTDGINRAQLRGKAVIYRAIGKNP